MVSQNSSQNTGQKKLYNEPGKWKYSDRRSPDKTAETQVDPYEKAPGYTGKIPFEIRNGQHGTFRKVLYVTQIKEVSCNDCEKQ